MLFPDGSGRVGKGRDSFLPRLGKSASRRLEQQRPVSRFDTSQILNLSAVHLLLKNSLRAPVFCSAQAADCRFPNSTQGAVRQDAQSGLMETTHAFTNHGRSHGEAQRRRSHTTPHLILTKTKKDGAMGAAPFNGCGDSSTAPPASVTCLAGSVRERRNARLPVPPAHAPLLPLFRRGGALLGLFSVRSPSFGSSLRRGVVAPLPVPKALGFFRCCSAPPRRTRGG